MHPVEPVAVPESEAALVVLLRAGDEATFAALLDRYHAGMVRLAMLYVRDRAVAEEVAQDAWLGVLRGVHRFEARASLKTWLFNILVNCAKAQGERERRTIPFSSVWDASAEPVERAVDPERFRPPNAPQWPGHWVPATAPRTWGENPEERLLASETRREIGRAVDALPAAQRAVILLRDVEGWTAAEVCELLHVAETNQRVLLHRARSKVRRALEQYLDQQ